MVEPLKDISKSGKERPWNQKKAMSKDVASIYEETSSVYGKETLERKADRMNGCGDVLTFKKTGEGLKLNQAYFCKVRLCPMCNWRRSLKLTYDNKKIVEVANSKQKLRWLFLTLTVKNCKGNELEGTIKNMMKAYHRLMDYKRIDESIEGWFRALEITKDNDEVITQNRFDKNPSYYKSVGLAVGDRNPNYNTYHPHFHVLICVKPSYFSRKSKYISQEEWTSLWQKAMKLDYTPIVHVQAVKAKKTKKGFKEIVADIEKSISEEQAIQKAILETSKYTVKDTDILTGTEQQKIETVFTLDGAMANKRLVAWGKSLKKIRDELRLEEKENDLIHIESETPDDVSEEIQKVTAYWHIGLKTYVIKE